MQNAMSVTSSIGRQCDGTVDVDVREFHGSMILPFCQGINGQCVVLQRFNLPEIALVLIREW
jgi:hypothetical protein